MMKLNTSIQNNYIYPKENSTKQNNSVNAVSFGLKPIRLDNQIVREPSKLLLALKGGANAIGYVVGDVASIIFKCIAGPTKFLYNRKKGLYKVALCTAITYACGSFVNNVGYSPDKKAETERMMTMYNASPDEFINYLVHDTTSAEIKLNGKDIKVENIDISRKNANNFTLCAGINVNGKPGTVDAHVTKNSGGNIILDYDTYNEDQRTSNSNNIIEGNLGKNGRNFVLKVNGSDVDVAINSDHVDFKTKKGQNSAKFNLKRITKDDTNNYSALDKTKQILGGLFTIIGSVATFIYAAMTLFNKDEDNELIN